MKSDILKTKLKGKHNDFTTKEEASSSSSYGRGEAGIEGGAEGGAEAGAEAGDRAPHIIMAFLTKTLVVGSPGAFIAE